ncbi:MAG: ABC transporter permease subunit [Steroidobacteraceae bacterium]
MRIAVVALIAATLQLTATAAPDRTEASGVFIRPGTITFCTQLDQPPADFTAPDGATPEGFEVDIMKAIGRKLGLRTAIVNFQYAALAPALDAGLCDALMASTTSTPERRKKYRFIEYMRASSALLVPRGNPLALRTYADLSGRRVAVLLGTINERRLEDASSRLVADGRPAIRIAAYQSTPVAFNELQLGRVDAFVSGSLTLAYYLSRAPGRYELGGLPVAAGDYGIMLPRGEVARADLIGKAYSTLYHDGTLTRIVEKWGATGDITLCDGKCFDESGSGNSSRPAIVRLTGVAASPARSKNVHFDLRFFINFVFHPPSTLIAGLGITVAAASVSMIFGGLFGAVLAIFAISRHRALRWSHQVYIGFFRGTPVLVQLVLVYFGLPALLGFDLFPASMPVLGLHLSGALVAGIVTFSLHEAAFSSEIFRAGIQSIDVGQREAAQSLGMPPGLVMRRIILPQALRVCLPALANQCNLMLKTTSLLSVIAIPELFQVATAIQSATYRTFEVYLGVSVYYLALTGVVTLGQRRAEAIFSTSDRAQRVREKPSGSVRSSYEG